MPRTIQRITKQAFWNHLHSAKRRGIEFLLTFEEWLKIWMDSEHWHERGIRKYQYCMARFGDKGPYAVGNVKIITNEENLLERVLPKPTHETRIKTSERMKGNKFTLGYKHTDEAKKKIGEAARINMLGYKHTPQALINMSRAQKGRITSKEAKKNMIAAQRKRREDEINQGVPHPLKKHDLPCGVYKYRNNKYTSHISVNGKTKYLGIFERPYEAHQAWLKARNEYLPK